MARVTDNICKLRDILEKKQYDKLVFAHKIINDIFNEVHRHMARKSEDYSYQLEFTSQDLRETAQTISDTLKRWDNVMCPDKNIKILLNSVKEHKLDLNPFINKTLPVMAFRRDNIQKLIELKSMLEYHSVFLYFLEEASKDEFALNFTKRLK